MFNKKTLVDQSIYTTITPKVLAVNFDKLKNTFGYEPIHDVEFGIKEIINSLKSNDYNNHSLYGNYLINSSFND